MEFNIGDNVTIKDTNTVWDSKEGVIKDIIDYNGNVTYLVYVTFNKEEAKYILQNFSANNIFKDGVDNYTEIEEKLNTGANFVATDRLSKIDTLANTIGVKQKAIQESLDSIKYRNEDDIYLVFTKEELNNYITECIKKDILTNGYTHCLQDISEDVIFKKLFKKDYIKECAKQSIFNYYNNIDEQTLIEDYYTVTSDEKSIEDNNVEYMIERLVETELSKLKTQQDYYIYTDKTLLKEDLKKQTNIDQNNVINIDKLVEELIKNNSYTKYINNYDKTILDNSYYTIIKIF